MQHVTVEHLCVRFGTTRALDDVSLHVDAGELFFLLGPSGCGKTTLLRSIAGFCEPDSGRILVGGSDMTRVAPQDRNTAMVFQSYALWPHMSVRENVAFGLTLRKVRGAEADRRIREALALVQMEALADRRPAQLSGGQQQRVAVARALVVRPGCMLLDEPLSNLDARLRAHMRTELRRICKDAGLTAIYVTHDRKEALGMADRAAVMRDGRIAQVGAPSALYHAPSDAFVADFLGDVQFLEAEAARADGSHAWRITTPLGSFLTTGAEPPDGRPGRVRAGLRPESLSPARGGETGGLLFKARIRNVQFLGEVTQFTLRTESPLAPSLACLARSGDAGLPCQGELGTWHVPAERIMLLPAGTVQETGAATT